MFVKPSRRGGKSGRHAALFSSLLILTLVGTGRAPERGTRPVRAQDFPPDQAYAPVATWQSRDLPLPPDAFEAPRGIAVDPFDGSVFIVDSGNHRVQVFQPDGAFLRTIGGPGVAPKGLDDPAGVAISGGRVYVTDFGNDRVAVFDIDGGYRGEWTGLEGPWGIVSWVDGRVFVTENRGSRIAVFGSDGTRQATWGRFGGGDDLNRPEGLALTAGGALLVANTGNDRVLLLDDAGVVADSTGDLGVAPRDVAVHPRGELYLTADDGTLRRHGLGLGLPSLGPPSPLPGALGLTAAAGGRVYASFQDDGRPLHGVQLRDGGQVVDEWGKVPLPLGLIDAPRRIWASANGAVTETLLLDRRRRAQGFDAQGEALWQVPMGAANDLLGLSGGDVFAIADGSAARLAPGGVERWRTRLPGTLVDAPWAVAAHGTADGSRVEVLDVGLQRLHRLDPADGVIGDASSFRPGPGAFTALWDVDSAGPQRRWAVNRSAGTLELRASDDLSVVDAWQVPGSPLRVAGDAEGNAFVLNRHGWIWKYAKDGRLHAVWQGGNAGDESSRPVDVAVDARGRVLVADAGLDRVAVFAVDPTGEPGEIPTFDPGCEAVGDKRAAPPRVVLGETVDVELSIEGACPRVRGDADIALVIDVSGSMIGEKIDAAKAAARDFVDTIDFVDMRVALVAFNQAAVLAQPLTANPVNVAVAVDGLQAGGGTNIAVALDEARRELTGPRRRPSAASVVILLTDGGSAAAPALQAAQLARLEGARIFTIGFGAGAAEDLLRQIASAPDDYAFAPDAAGLAAIYRRIAQRIVAQVLFSSVDVVDEIPTDMRYVTDSAEPPATFDGSRLLWRLSDVPFAGTVLRYRLEPLQVGERPTNVFAVGEGVDGLGGPLRVDFPIPVVEVVTPTATPTPRPGITPSTTPSPTATPTPSATPTITPTPAPIYLPATANESCPKRRAQVDVVLILDASTSMSAPTRAGRRKLDAAVEAAGAFLSLLELDPDAGQESDRAALVVFNDSARLASPLTAEAGRVARGLAAIEQRAGTRIDLGLIRAAEVLEPLPEDEERVRAAVLLTDGRPTGTTVEFVLEAAGRLRLAGGREGAWVYAIGLGGDVDAALLAEVATDEQRLVLAPDAEDLARVYREIARELPCIRR